VLKILKDGRFRCQVLITVVSLLPIPDTLFEDHWFRCMMVIFI
jgi:hypothetical protein